MSVPKLRFKEFDGDWGFKKIGDISECIVPGRNKPKLFDGDIPWVTTPDLKDKTYVSDTRSNYYISEEEAKTVGSKIVPANSVIMSCVGDLGLFAINTKPIVINQQLHAFILDDHKYSSIFILNALSKNQDYIEKVATKTALPYLNKDNCNSIPLFLCSFKEQTKIASFLSSVDEKISQLNQKHELLSQYKQGMMQKLFSQQIRFKADDGSEFGEWGNYSLKNLLLKVIDNRGKTPNTSPELEIPLIEINAIGQRNVTYSKVSKFVSKETFKNWFRAYLDDQDILFSTVGNTAICSIYSSQIQAGIAQNIIGLRAKREIIEPVFLYYLLTEDINNKKFKSIEMQAVQPSIKVSQMIHLNFLVPCLEEQTKIANFLSSIDQKIEVVAQQIEQAKQWKKGLLQQMFV